eukprot:g6340.t1
MVVMGGMIVTAALNFALYKSMFTAFGPANAYFVSQGVNVLYVIYGGIILAWKLRFTDHITPQMRALPARKFALMGLLDSLGTFLTAMGAVFTPGVFQTLLNQTLVPFTMLFSVAFLRARYGAKQAGGAALIVAGAALTVLPAALDPTKAASAQFRWYAALVFCLSNVPM